MWDWLTDKWDTFSDSNVWDWINPFNWANYFQGKQSTRANIDMWNTARQDQLNADLMNRQMAYDFAKHGIDWKIEAGKRYGINPLVSMGASTSYGPTSMVNTSGPNIRPAQFDAAAAWGQRKLENRMMRAQAESLELTNLQKKLDIIEGQADVEKQPDRPIAGTGGATAGVHQQYKVVQLDDGFILKNLDQAEFEDDPMAFFQTAGKKMGTYFKSVFRPVLSDRQKRMLDDTIRRQRNIMLQVRPLPKGRTYKLNRRNGTFVEARDDGFLYMDQTQKYDYITIPVPWGKKRR